MIKNQRQYRITKRQAAKFEQALAEMIERPYTDSTIHPLLRRAEEEGVRNQLLVLREQIAEYEALQVGQSSVIEPQSFEDLPRALIQSRIAAGLSQKDLAERVGIKEQQLQRYEATEYAAASVQRVLQIVQALRSYATAQ